MNQNIIDGFIKRAQEVGLSKEQAERFLSDNLNINTKTAEQKLDEVITSILTDSGVEKSAQSAAYIEGVLKAAIDKGCNDNQAIEFAKIAATNSNLKKMPPIPNNNGKNGEKMAAYAEGFMKAAQEKGFTEGQSLDLLKFAVNHGRQPAPVEKKADMGGMGGMDGGMDPAMMQQIMQMLQGGGGAAQQAAPPQGGGLDINSLLASLGGGGGGAGGAGGGSMFKQLPGAAQ
jgi:hypothetical protein